MNSNSRSWVALDLDGTVLFPADSERDMTVITHRDGQPSTAIPSELLLMLQALSKQFAIVPITSRRRSSFERVVLPGVPFRWAGVCHGGELLREGRDLDEHWRDRVITASLEYGPSLQATFVELSEELCTEPGDSPSLVEAEDVGAIYFRCSTASHERGLKLYMDIRDRLNPTEWEISRAGTHVHATPVAVSKNALVQHLRDTHFGGNPPVLALGDGLADIGLLREARLAATPVNSDLWKLAAECINETF